jgi:hypothetical protein
MVDRSRLGVFTQPDHDHFHQPAFIRSVKIGMHLDAVDDDRAVSSMRMAVEVYRDR